MLTPAPPGGNTRRDLNTGHPRAGLGNNNNTVANTDIGHLARGDVTGDLTITLQVLFVCLR